MARLWATLAAISGLLLASGAHAADSIAAVVVARGGTVAELGFFTNREDSFTVSAKGRRVTVTLTHGRGVEGAASQYTTEGRVTQRSIHASFGELGRISVRFRSKGRPLVEPPPFNCEGRPESTTRGTFSGTIRFRSEDGAYDVDSERANGQVHVIPRRRCRWTDGSPPERAPKQVLLKASDCAGRTIAIAVPLGEPAFRVDEGGTVTFASSFERRGRMRIFRFAFALTPRTPITYPPDLSSAVFAAPNLFSGSAAFSRDPEGVGAWTGTLLAEFPGKELEMAGASFRASLQRLPLEKGVFDLDYRRLCSR
jgi:hypothetical protein